MPRYASHQHVMEALSKELPKPARKVLVRYFKPDMKSAAVDITWSNLLPCKEYDHFLYYTIDGTDVIVPKRSTAYCLHPAELNVFAPLDKNGTPVRIRNTVLKKFQGRDNWHRWTYYVDSPRNPEYRIIKLSADTSSTVKSLIHDALNHLKSSPHLMEDICSDLGVQECVRLLHDAMSP